MTVQSAKPCKILAGSYGRLASHVDSRSLRLPTALLVPPNWWQHVNLFSISSLIWRPLKSPPKDESKVKKCFLLGRLFDLLITYNSEPTVNSWLFVLPAFSPGTDNWYISFVFEDTLYIRGCKDLEWSSSIRSTGHFPSFSLLNLLFWCFGLKEDKGWHKYCWKLSATEEKKKQRWSR